MPFTSSMFVSAARYHAQAIAETELRKMQLDMEVKLMQLHSRLAPKARGKCPGCGSHEFRKHYLRTICSYCRVEV